MNNFRVTDTKFRILKGGKVGLAMSIAMIGGMIFGGTNLNATMTVDGSTTSSTTFYSNSGTYYGGWYSSSYGYNRDSYILSNTFAATTGGNIILGDGATVLSMTTGSQAATAINPYTYYYVAYRDNDSDSPSTGIGSYAGRQYDIYLIDITNSSYYSVYGWTNDIWSGAIQNGSGPADYFYYVYTGYSINTTLTSDYYTGSAASDAGYAINASGTVTLYGNNIIDGSATAASFNVTGSNNQFNGAVDASSNGTITLSGDNNHFTNTVTAGNINVAGLNNTFSGAVASNVNFTSAGSVALADGADLTGNVAFGSHNATLTLSNGSNIVGSVSGTGTDNGTLNFEGSSNVTAGVGLIKDINVGGNTSLVNLDTISGNTTVNALNINADRAVVQVGGLLTANTVLMGGHYSKLELLDRSTTLAVSSVVSNATTGAQTAASFYKDGMVGTIDFGTYNATTNVPATGTQGKGTLEIGDNVDVTFSTNPANGINAVNANNATLVFAGSSTVGGNVGTSHTSTDTFNQIWAGAADEIVTFANDVYVGVDSATATTAGSLSTTSTHKLTTGSGTVNLNGNLYGNLVIGASSTPVSVEGTAYSSYGDGSIGGTWTTGGTVNIAHNKSVEGSITTASGGTGTLNFMGSSNYSSVIGASNAKLLVVTFNSASTGSSTVGFTADISNNVYANTVTIGNGSGESKVTSLVDASGSYDYAGATNMKVWTGGTVANIGSSVTTLGDALVMNNDKDAINFGTAHVNAATSFTTNNSAMSFTVNTQDITGINQAQSTSTGSGQVTTAALNMGGSEKIQINYVGSLKNAGTYTLISDTGTTGTGTYSHVEGDGYVTDNSFVIDTKISTANTLSLHGQDLILTADRTASAAYASNQLYIQKSNTVGHFSNNAAVVLAGIAADGSQTGDMVQVIQKMELDSFGYGNNAENLAVQAKRLAPIANNSIALSSMDATTLGLNTVGARIAEVRNGEAMISGMSAGDEDLSKGYWAKIIGSTAEKEKDGMYDGYKSTSYGVAMGFDKKFKNDAILGIALGYTKTDVDQKDFRDGDKASTDTVQAMIYASKEYKNAYVDGALTYANHNTDSTRAAAVGRIANANIDAQQYGAKLSGGYRFNIKDKATITPYLSLEYTHINQDEYTETGAGDINLKVDEISMDRGTVGAGFKLATKIEKNSKIYTPEFKLGAYRYFGTSNTDVTAQYVGGGEKFVTPSSDMDKTMYNASLGLKAQLSNTSSLGFNVDYDRSSNGLFEGYTGQLSLRVQF